MNITFTKLLTAASFCMGISATCIAQSTLLNIYENKYSQEIGTYQNITFRDGGFSGLYAIPGTEGREFYTLSDRGVNTDAKNAACTPTYEKIFPFPSFAPTIYRIRINGDSIQILQSTTIKRPDGTGATGLINPTGYGSTEKEQIWNDTISDCSNKAAKTLAKDIWGLDSEGIVIGKDNDFWVCEEGGVTIWNIDRDGKVLRRYTPFGGQPEAQEEDQAIDSVFKYRRVNRGFEGIALTPSGKIYALIQSPLYYPDAATGDASQIHRLLELDPETGATRMFVYLNPGDLTVDGNKIKKKDWKIGDLAAINDTTFLVIEHAFTGTNIQKNIWKINISEATPITTANINDTPLESIAPAKLADFNIVPVTKTLFLDLRAAGWPDDLDKPEGLAIIDDSTIAVCNDNDYGQVSPNQDGTIIATGTKSKLFTFRLDAANKLAHYKSPFPGNPDVVTSAQQKSATALSVYPNPAGNGQVHFTKPVSFTLTDMMGTILLNEKKAETFSTSDLKPGLYIISTEETTLKLIVK